MRFIRSLAVALLGLAAVSQAALAGPIATRGDLETLLGGAGTLETFQAFASSPEGFDYVDCNPLTSTATCNGQGPGLIVPGLSITGNPAWIDAGYIGLPSRMLGDGDGADDVFDFTTPVTAFGADLFAFDQFASPNASITIFGVDDVTIIGQITNIGLTLAGSFVGWSDLNGIGSFVMGYGGALPTFIPNIDNLEFGTAAASVPEPGTLALLGLGLAGLAAGRRRRK
jgi:PEP-CTERM motif